MKAMVKRVGAGRRRGGSDTHPFSKRATSSSPFREDILAVLPDAVAGKS